MQLDPDKIYEKLVGLGEEWADAHGAAALLSETKKTLLAQLMLQSEAKSISAKEMEALADERYKRHIEAMVAAGKMADKTKVRWESAKIWSELKRTESANERATLGRAV